jgi:hypothetical protein
MCCTLRRRSYLAILNQECQTTGDDGSVQQMPMLSAVSLFLFVLRKAEYPSKLSCHRIEPAASLAGTRSTILWILRQNRQNVESPANSNTSDG